MWSIYRNFSGLFTGYEMAYSTASHVGRNSSPTDLRDIAQALSAVQSSTITAALAEEAARLEQSRGAGSAPAPITVDAMARAI